MTRAKSQRPRKTAADRPTRRRPADPPAFWEELDENEFEELCCSLLRVQKGIASCDRFGLRGEGQLGIDLRAERVSGDGIEVAQCKCESSFPPAEIRAASAEFFKHWPYWRERNVRRFYPP